MPRCCICYTTDAGYLFPTLISAIQARRHTAIEKADVAIFAFGVGAAALEAFRRPCRAEKIQLLPVAPSLIDGAPAMLARLFLTRFVPDQYDQFLYIDGDTQISRSLDTLVDAEIPPGKFMAVDDPMVFALPGTGNHSRGIAEHFQSIGFNDFDAHSYFNTGVLRVSREGWESIGLAAWRLFQQGDQESRFPDQDVLNIAGASSRIPISLAWNFPIFMLNSRVERSISPRIYHFMSNPKPWHGVFPPWGRAARTPYLVVAAKYPALMPYYSTMPIATRFRYHLQQRYKKTLETFTWGLSSKRSRILAYERGLTDLAGQP